MHASLARVVVALAESAEPSEVQIFSGSIAGELLRAPRGGEELGADGFSRSRGWDRLWVPDGYGRTLGEMAGSAYVVNMRALPYLDPRSLPSHALDLPLRDGDEPGEQEGGDEREACEQTEPEPARAMTELEPEEQREWKADEPVSADVGDERKAYVAGAA
jgi:hypothetical protein